MKTKSYLIGLLLLAVGLLAIITHRAPAQGNPRDNHQAVMMGDGPASHYDENGRYVADGLVVAWVDASPGAPTVPRGTSTSTAIAIYLNQGFSHEVVVYGVHLFKK